MMADVRKRAWQAYQRRRVGARRFGRLGAGSCFQPPATIVGAEHIFIGAGTFFHSGAWLSVVDEHNGRRYQPRLTIGDRCLFGRDFYVSCVGEITIGDEVQVADRVLITDTHHEYADPDVSIIRQPMATPRPVRIGDGALLNAGCAITAGTTIGARSVVAANAVVTRDVPAHTVVAGNPARAIRAYDHGRREWVDL